MSHGQPPEIEKEGVSSIFRRRFSHINLRLIFTSSLLARATQPSSLHTTATEYILKSFAKLSALESCLHLLDLLDPRERL
jgi:hypothetical protein